MTGLRLRLLLAAFGGVAAITVASTSAAAPPTATPDLKLAVHTDAGCGPFGDSLPPIVVEAEVVAGSTVADRTVCVLSADAAGRALTIQAVELVDVDAGCTGDEALVDASCGQNQAGELSTALNQRVEVGPCRQVARASTEVEASLRELAMAPQLIARRIGEDKELCVRLIMTYSANVAAAVVTQSDRATWSYEFGVGD